MKTRVRTIAFQVRSERVRDQKLRISAQTRLVTISVWLLFSVHFSGGGIAEQSESDFAACVFVSSIAAAFQFLVVATIYEVDLFCVCILYRRRVIVFERSRGSSKNSVRESVFLWYIGASGYWS